MKDQNTNPGKNQGADPADHQNDKNKGAGTGQTNENTPPKEGDKPSEVKQGKASKKAQDYFKRRPSVTELFETSDSFLFVDPYLAKQHAKTLKNKTLKIIKPTK